MAFVALADIDDLDDLFAEEAVAPGEAAARLNFRDRPGE